MTACRVRKAILLFAIAALCGLCLPARAQRFTDATLSGPFAWLTGIVLRTAVGPLTGGDWVDLTAADWDRDGSLDLFVGSGYGDLLFFRRRPDGTFDPPSGLGSAQPDPFAFEPARSQACPAACDWDGDGDIDLLLATEQKVFFYETRPSDAGPVFAPGVELLAEGAKRLLPAPDCSISAVRLLPGALPDLFISCPDGRLLVAKRKGKDVFEAPTEALPAGNLPRARADVADFDGDGVPDLVVGTGNGRAFLRQGTVVEGRLAFGDATPIGSADGRVPSPDGAPLQDLSPRCVDWDGDGDADLLLGCRSGHILFLERAAPDQLVARGYLQETNAPIDAGRCAVADLGDWDGDGKPDLVVGGEGGFIRIYPDQGRAAEGLFGSPQVLGARNAPWHVEGGYSWPAIMPRTGGRFATLAVGGNGAVSLLTANNTGVTGVEKLSAGGRVIKLAPVATVSTCDYDQDGGADLFIGARERPGEPLGGVQPIIYLENGAGPGRPPAFSKAAQVELYTGGPAADSPLQEAGDLRPYAVSVADWIPGGNAEFIVVGAQGVDLFTTPSRRAIYPTLFLAPGEGSRLLPPVYSCRAVSLLGQPGLLVGTEAYGILCWYPRSAWERFSGK